MARPHASVAKVEALGSEIRRDLKALAKRLQAFADEPLPMGTSSVSPQFQKSNLGPRDFGVLADQISEAAMETAKQPLPSRIILLQQTEQIR